MKFKEIYRLLPGKRLVLTDWALKGHWLPELPDFEWQLCDELLQALESQGRVWVVEHLLDVFDGERYAQLASLWFDGEPVALMQDAGRSGRDHRQRWVSDLERYAQLVAHIRQQLKLQVQDAIDPDTEVYPDTVLEFYGCDYSDKLGLACEPRMMDVHLLRGDNLPELKLEPGTHLVLFESGVQPPDFARRGQYHLRHTACLTDTPQWKASPARQLLESRGLVNAHSYQEIDRADVPAGTCVVRI